MSKSHRSNVPALVLLALPVMFFTLPAWANSSAADLPAVTVRFHDLNLQNPEGVLGLYARIRTAAVAVCSSSEDSQSGDHWYRMRRETCINHAVANAVRSVHNGKLNAYHWQRIRGWRHASGEITLADGAK